MEHETKISAPAKKQVSTALQVTGVLFALASYPLFLIGLPLMLFLGLGILFWIVGAIQVYIGVGIYKARKSAYVPALVVGIISVLSMYNKYQMFALVPVLFLLVIYMNRDEFVN